MVTSYEVISLDHLAEHMTHLSTASSFWFSLNSSYNHKFNLSKRLGLTPQDYEFVLVAADLALFHKRYGFSIKLMKWSSLRDIASRQSTVIARLKSMKKGRSKCFDEGRASKA
jgi:hypothetical protein